MHFAGWFRCFKTAHVFWSMSSPARMQTTHDECPTPTGRPTAYQQIRKGSCACTLVDLAAFCIETRLALLIPPKKLSSAFRSVQKYVNIRLCVEKRSNKSFLLYRVENHQFTLDPRVMPASKTYLFCSALSSQMECRRCRSPAYRQASVCVRTDRGSCFPH